MKLSMAIKTYMENDMHCEGSPVKLGDIKPFLQDKDKEAYKAELSEYLGVPVGA